MSLTSHGPATTLNSADIVRTLAPLQKVLLDNTAPVQESTTFSRKGKYRIVNILGFVGNTVFFIILNFDVVL